MCNIEEARCNGLKILIPKHMRKSKNELLEQISAKNPYVTFFLGHPVHHQKAEHLRIPKFWLKLNFGTSHPLPPYIQGDPKKMSHKDFELKSLLEVRFYFSTCVLESEFPARSIEPLKL